MRVCFLQDQAAVTWPWMALSAATAAFCAAQPFISQCEPQQQVWLSAQFLLCELSCLQVSKSDCCLIVCVECLGSHK